MINWLVNRIFRWDSLRHAIFDEVRLYQSIDKTMWNMERKNPTNLTWSEGDRWYGWTFNPISNRYYFDDIGNESLMGLWEDQWLREADTTNKSIDHSKQAPADVLAGKYGPGVYLAYEKYEKEQGIVRE